MSGVYISMEMPTEGHILSLVLRSDGKVLGANSAKLLGKAVPVPPHGRLIDADALWKEEKSADALHKLRPKGESVIYDAGFLAGYRAAAQIASRMPTIIPADKDGAK